MNALKLKNGAIITNGVIRLWEVSCKINVVEKIAERSNVYHVQKKSIKSLCYSIKTCKLKRFSCGIKNKNYKISGKYKEIGMHKDL